MAEVNALYDHKSFGRKFSEFNCKSARAAQANNVGGVTSSWEIFSNFPLRFVKVVSLIISQDLVR